jgi:hydrogenase maturation factor
MTGLIPQINQLEAQAKSFDERAEKLAAEAALAALRSMPGGEEAAEIGECKTEPEGMVLMATAFGGKRVMDQLVGDPLPRIC